MLTTTVSSFNCTQEPNKLTERLTQLYPTKGTKAKEPRYKRFPLTYIVY